MIKSKLLCRKLVDLALNRMLTTPVGSLLLCNRTFLYRLYVILIFTVCGLEVFVIHRKMCNMRKPGIFKTHVKRALN